MKIANKTRWQTADLRRFVETVLRHQGHDPKETWHVTFAPGRKSSPSGWAYLNSRTFQLTLAKKFLLQRPGADGKTTLSREEPETLPRSVLLKLAQVAIHEIGHCEGLSHAEMVPWHAIDVSWLPEDLTINRIPAPKKPSREEKNAAELQHALDKIVSLTDAIAAAEKNIKALRTRRSNWRKEAAKIRKRKLK